MRLEKVQDALRRKKTEFEYSEADGCGSLDFYYRGLSYHVWEWNDGDEWGAETNVFNVGKSRDVDGDYEEEISAHILSWPDMLV